MYIKKISALIFTGALMLNNMTFAAESVSMTLEKAIGLALGNNHTITQYTEDRESARWGLSATRRNFGPRLSWSNTTGYIGGKYYRPQQDYYAENHFYYDDEEYEKHIGGDLNKLPPYHMESTNSFTLSMPLYTGGKLENQIESAEYSLNSADLSLEYARQYVRYQTAEAYYQVLQRNAEIQIQQEAVNYLQSHLENVQIQYEVGTVAKADVLSTAVQLADYKRQLNSAWGNYESSVANLNNVMGIPVDTVLVTDEELTNNPYPISEEECMIYALEHRPDGLAAEYAVKKAEADVNVTKAGYRPTVNAIARGVLIGENPFESNHNNQEYWQIGLSLDWNIFDNGITSAQVNQAKAVERKAESQKLQQIDRIKLDVHNAYIAILTAEKNVNVSSNAVKEAEDAYEIAKVRYTEGVDTNLNVMDAQTKLAQAKNNYYNALYNFNVSKAKMEQVIGVPVQIDPLRYVIAVDEGKTSPKALESADIFLMYEDGEVLQSDMK